MSSLFFFFSLLSGATHGPHWLILFDVGTRMKGAMSDRVVYRLVRVFSSQPEATSRWLCKDLAVSLNDLERLRAVR